jgi:hypothetical protein
LFGNKGFSQAGPNAWWANIHGWNGISAWEDFLTVSPYYFGPNALIVPEMNSAKIVNQFEIRQDAWTHQSSGDKTYNLFSQLNIPLFSNRVSMQVFVVPIEYYELTELERDRRASRRQDAKGFVGGDFWINTSVLAVDEDKAGFAVVGRVGLKTASGRGVEGARYTDAPAYFLDATIGKNFIDKTNEKLRFSLVQGFYVWQLLGTGQKQNDAYLYGVEVDFQKNKWFFNSSLTGFRGFINNGDRPLVSRINAGFNYNENTDFTLRFQKGLHNFNYTSVALSFIYRFGKQF